MIRILRILTVAFAIVAPFATGISQAETKSGDAAMEARVHQLLAEMSPSEKIGQMSQLFYFGKDVNLPGSASGGPSVEDLIAKGSAGSLLFITDPAVINLRQRI